MKSVKYDVTYSESASRLELIVRFIWMIPSYIVAMVLAFIGLLALCFQWLHILVFGKRNRFLHGWILKLMAYEVKLKSYCCLLTDERSPIFPED